MGAVVAVEGPQPAAERFGVFRPHYCSGVIITPEGLILSQFHVSHQLPGKPDTTGLPAWSEKSRRPGERTTVILHDGRELQAELLGANQTFDLSLLRLVESGPYPYATLDPSATVSLGDWVLKLGHPIGYRQGRPPVVRLGRVLFQHSDVFITDCLTVGGDSGGPFFDLNGRLVGIIGQGAIPAKYFSSLSNRGTGPAADPTNRLIQQHFDAMLRREIAPLDERASEGFLAGYLGVEDDEILPREHWSQGAAVAKVFQAVIRDARPSAVSIVDERGRDVVLGTVVRADGWIATIASMLPDQPKCRLSDAWIVDAQVVGMDPAFDLALLKIPVTGLPAVRWAEKAPLVAGTILAAAGPPENPLGIGVVSVPRRDLPGPFPTHVRRPTIRPQPLWVQGRSTAEGYVVDICSENAGFLRGDILLSVAGREIHSKKDAHDCVDGHQVGEQVPVRLIRDGKRLDLTLELVAEPLTNSKAYADFPTLFETRHTPAARPVWRAAR